MQRAGAGEKGVVERAARAREEEAAARAAMAMAPLDSNEVAGLILSSFSESLMRCLMAPCDGFDFDQGESDAVHACFQQHLQDTAWECFAGNAERDADGNIIEDPPRP
jgi:hypothetical protein